MRYRRWLLGLSLVPAVLLASHAAVRVVARVEAPPVAIPVLPIDEAGQSRQRGRSSVERVGKLLVVRLAGSPEEIGSDHATLLRKEMETTEAVVWDLLEEKVPNRLARALLLDLGQLAYRGVHEGMSPARLREIAAGALSFQPDPFSHHFPTFQRFVYLNALYDMSLAYERSPLIGCTTFVFSGARAEGSPLLARAFDFDVSDVFDDHKAVFVVSEDGMIPFVSVAWPGLAGVVSGINREGLSAVVHGARAGPVRTRGEPLVHELRRLLSTARTTQEAITCLARTEPLVSHLVILLDGAGSGVVVERVPGAPPFSRKLGDAAAVTNHLEGPYSNDEKNQYVRRTTSTQDRRARGDELVAATSTKATATDAVRLLRDRSAAGGKPLALGDRRAIDALIATHGVVFETRAKRLWVSESPHLLGRFVAFDVETLIAPPRAAVTEPAAAIPEDPLLSSEEYRAFRAGGSGRSP